MDSSKSYLTARARNKVPTPTRWLIKHNLISPDNVVLDYGCGRCANINPPKWDNYDPHYNPIKLSSKYDRIICNYVLNTIPSPNERMDILKKIQSHLTSNGIAYISIRDDSNSLKKGFIKRGTYQDTLQDINLPMIHKSSLFRIYTLTPNTKLI